MGLVPLRVTVLCCPDRFPARVGRQESDRPGWGGTMTEVPLTRGYVAVIDDEHADVASGYRWRVLVQPHTCYAVARLPRLFGKQRSLYLHRLILNAGPGERVEHVDRNGLVNCRANLRIRPVGIGAMWPTSGQPSSREEGVKWHAESGKWSANFADDDGRTIHLGMYDTEWRAILRRDFAQMRGWGMVPESMSFERFLVWRPAVENGSLYDVEHLMEQAWRERKGKRAARDAVRRRND